MPEPRKHIVISGTGRAGTTFLVELFTFLEMNTGYTREEIVQFKNQTARAGLEQDIRKPDAPYIVKDPAFCDYAAEIVQREEIIIDHLFIPVRNIYEAAESRRYVQQEALKKLNFLQRYKLRRKKRLLPGGLLDTREEGKQEYILLQKFFTLMHSIAHTFIPVTFLSYPLLIQDCRYCYNKLLPALNNTSYEQFEQAFQMAAQPELVNHYAN